MRHEVVEPDLASGRPTLTMPNPDERPPVESQVIDERDVQPMGEGHVDDDPAPRPQFPPPSYEANQAVRGQDAHPGGGTDPGNARTEDRP